MSVRPARPGTLALFLAGYAAFVILANAALAAGLLASAVLADLIGLVVIVGVVLIGYGGLRPAHLGLVAGRLPLAAAGVLGVWLVAQALMAAGSLAAGDGLEIAAAWSSAGTLLGAMGAQLAGNALLEETAWRGYLLRQLLARNEGRAEASRTWRALAVLLAASLFAVAHLPAHLLGGAGLDMLAARLVALTLAGVVFSAIFLATGNLWFTVGIHALANVPSPLFASGGEAAPVTVGVGLFAAAAWLAIRRNRGRREAVRADYDGHVPARRHADR